MELIDTHAHLDEPAFATDLPEVLDRAREAGVAAFVTIGTTAESSEAAVELARTHRDVFAAVGIQPNYVAEAKPGDWQRIEELAAEEHVVALGETGLDRYWDYAAVELQQDYFARHVELSRQRDLPFVVHCREAETDVVAFLHEAAKDGPLRGVMHSFCGDAGTANACLELGLHVSFAGMVTYRKSEDLRQVAQGIPAERLLVETDAPYLVPHEIRRRKKAPKRNEPAFVVHTARCLADERGVPLEDLARQTTANARALFGLDR